MSHFLHTSMRLYSDVRRAYKRFTNVEELEKWFGSEIQGDIEEGATLKGILTELEKPFKIVYTTLEKETSIVFDFTAHLSDEVSNDDPYEVELRFMQCTSDTYYCTEIHLMQYGFDDTETSLKEREIYLEFWKEKLEVLRKMINKDWVIQDSELTLKCFM